MSDENTVAPSENVKMMREQIRAVTQQRDEFKARAAALEPLQEQVSALQTQLKTVTTRHEQDLHLTGLGITSKRAQRVLRREYQAEIAELGDAEPPAFADYLETLKNDQVFGVWFPSDAPAAAEAAPAPAAPAPRKPASSPNAGTDEPKPAPTSLANQYSALKARHGVDAGKMMLEALKKKGLVR